jgi:hypothetical protein
MNALNNLLLTGMASLMTLSWGGLFDKQPTTEPTFQPPEPAVQQTIEAPTVRHKINCNVTSLEDVKVIEKQPISIGQTLCDRTEQRQSLESKKQQLELSLQQKPTVNIQAEQLTLPPADFSVYEAAVIAARAELNRLQALPIVETFHYDTTMAQIMEPQRFNQQQKQQQQIADARYELAEAISDLNEAKMQRQEQEFKWLSQQQQRQQNLLIRQQEAESQWQYQKAMILNDLQEIEDKIAEITAVKSPYSGNIRRVKVISQAERNINVEISLIAQ